MTDPNAHERISLIVHAGAASAKAVLTEWWHPLNGESESRHVRFPGDDGIWLEGDSLPGELVAAGCRVSDVVGVENFPGLAHPAVAAGRTLHLQPEPANPYDRNAVAVFAEDRTTRVGYLPREVSAETTAEAHRLRSAFGALVVSETRHLESGQRSAIRVLVGPWKVWASMA